MPFLLALVLLVAFAIVACNANSRDAKGNYEKWDFKPGLYALIVCILAIWLWPYYGAAVTAFFSATGAHFSK